MSAPNGRPSTPQFLAGLRVLECGDGVAGAAAGATLAALGAHVTNVVVPGSLFRRLRPSLASGQSLLSVLLDADKEPIDEAAGARALVDPRASGFDLVIFDRVVAPVTTTADYLRQVAAHNRGVWVTISGFGLDGRDCDLAASELIVSAKSGLLAAATDPETGTPIRLAGNQALLAGGQAAALAACHGLDLFRRRGAPVHLDVSAQEAAIATGPVLRVIHALLNCTGDAGADRYGSPAGFYPCLDGVVRVSAMEDHQWRGMVTALDHPAWTESLTTSDVRRENAELIDHEIAQVTATMTKRDCEQLFQRHGVPATGRYAPDEILAWSNFAERGSLRSFEIDGRRLTAMGPAMREIPVERSGANASMATRVDGLAGLRVVEVGHVLAVPLAGSLLGAMGADVVKLEDPQRLDMYRRRRPFIDSVPGIERAAYFAAVNHSKRSVCVELDDHAALAEQLDGCDVVLENLGPERARRLGVDAMTIGGARPNTLAVSSSGFGHVGPCASYRAYAYNLQTSCGLGHLTCAPDGTPVPIDVAWADPVTAYAMATVIAAWAVGPGGGRGASIDLAMAELIASRFNEYLAAASVGVDAIDPRDRGNELYPYAPCGVYPTRDGQWIALSVPSEADWVGLRDALDRPAALADPRFSDPSSRFDDRQALDAALASLTCERTGAELARSLQARGIPAAVVEVAATLIADGHLETRGFFTPVEHPEWGVRRLIGVPWRVCGEGPISLGPPPRLDTDRSMADQLA